MGELFEVVDGQVGQAVIRVIGVGGGGCNTVNQMVDASIPGVDFICANTDRQHLERCKTNTVLQLGANTTRGLGAGSNPDTGRRSAEEDKERIRELIEGTDMLFITAGMGGGTGTGAAPVIAQIAKELEILTVAVVTKPFKFEGPKRMAAALKGIEELQQHVDSLIQIPNDRLLVVLGSKVTMVTAFKAANDVLQNAVQGISDLITRPGLQNLDFADVCTAMRNRGKAMMGLGHGHGDNRATEAAEMALTSPLLDDLELMNAKGLLVNITCDSSLTMEEVTTVTNRVNQIASDDVDFKWGCSQDDALAGQMRVTVLATGLGALKAAETGKSHVVVPIKQAQSAPAAHAPPGAPRRADYDVPAYVRHQPAAAAVAHGPHALHNLALEQEELLDIPAFLRHQAD